MIAISSNTRVLMAIDSVDFRKGIDGLCSICKQKLESDPFSGAMFVFCNRQRTSIKVLFFDSQGFCLYQKRLSKGRFKYWPKINGISSRLLATELQILIQNGDPKGADMAPAWRKIIN